MEGMSEMAAAKAATKARVSAPAAARGGLRLSSRYYITLGILVLAAVSMQALGNALALHFQKQPLPLKKSLYQLDVSKLLPEFELHPKQPPPLDHDTIETLGTEHYHGWNLVNRGLGKTDPARWCNVFVTYHTGKPDMVPHNPKECQQAGGLSLEGEHIVDFTVEAGGRKLVIPVSLLEFGVPGAPLGSQRRIVAYFFWTNGRFVTERIQVRRAMQNLSDRYAYYTKVEMWFGNPEQRLVADFESTKKAVAVLLGKLMPVLMSDHYQEWDAIRAGAPPIVAP
jgi:hypothetical protein